MSLVYASSQIAARISPTDAQLFLLQQLLILKQQIVAFDIEFVTPEVSLDFSSVTSTFWELRERGGLFNPLNLARLVGGGLVPRVVENMIDAKVELDGRLRTVINDFTNTSARRMMAAIAGREASKKTIDRQRAMWGVQSAIQRGVPFLRKKVDEYIEDVRTKETLMGAIQDQVLQDYEDFYVKQMENTTSGKTGKSHGKGREDELWDLETFAERTNSVFQVGTLGLGTTANEDGSDGSGSRSRSGST